uniref:Uncharacterized protein n=1 Tax=Arion vulgaris TaxID=1028688 RepID=A0A0B6ZJN5_9EUPU
MNFEQKNDAMISHCKVVDAIIGHVWVDLLFQVHLFKYFWNQVSCLHYIPLELVECIFHRRKQNLQIRKQALTNYTLQV